MLTRRLVFLVVWPGAPSSVLVFLFFSSFLPVKFLVLGPPFMFFVGGDLLLGGDEYHQ